MNETKGTITSSITRDGDVMAAQNVLVEEVITPDSRTGYVVFSYQLPPERDMIFTSLLQLNVGWDTHLTNQFHETISLCRIIKGMRINAWYSSSITDSIPPQAHAYWIEAILPSPAIRVMTDRIAYVDLENQFLYTGNPNNAADQLRFIISNVTKILDTNQNPIPLELLRSGQMVRVEYGDFQTASIPPQTPAYLIQILTY
ncbi:hypothetical protein [Clostridium sp. HBUAS56010]|uniref:hypothetical protein n=1 Tax=Clostridium sp. HBUAS56010 TaxID=2571127 RepID=UPI001177862C|nr:hypothetical protein [Clostridium sp. HBUAS56010]